MTTPNPRTGTQELSLVTALMLAAGACAAEPASDLAPVETAIAHSGAAASLLALDREHVVDDLYHYTLEVTVGDTTHARLRIHRIVREQAPWRPRPTDAAVMLLHGDFATFESNFAPALISDVAPDGGLAIVLARRGIDVWGVDRRWTLAEADATAEELADFADMGVAQVVGDVRDALQIARAIRVAGGDGGDRLTLGGFSRGAFITYAVAAAEAPLPAGQRQVGAITPIDIYAALGPEDEALRVRACNRRDRTVADMALYGPAFDNTFFNWMGQLAIDAPDDESPFFAPLTNRQGLLLFAAQTYFFYPATPVYHQTGAVIVDGMPTELRYSPERLIADWLVAAHPWQAAPEDIGTDSAWCADEGALDLAAIEVPVFHLGAAGGFGDHAQYTVDQLGSADVTLRVIRRLAPELEAEDFGHADLLYATDARALAWEELAGWILAR